MMKTYLASFTCDTPVSIRDYPFLGTSQKPKILRNEFIYTDLRVIVQTYDNIVKFDSITTRRGLRVDVTLDSTDIDSSIEKAGSYADAVVSFLVLSTSCFAPVVRFDFVYEVTARIGKREYLRDFYLEQLRPLIHRKVEPSIFGQIFKAVSQYEDITAQVSDRSEWQLRTRLQRAVVYFRKGIGTDDCVDEFVYYWLALEALNHLLPHEKNGFPLKTCVACKRAVDICPHCGKDPKCFATTSPLYGVEKLADDVGVTKPEFRDLVKLRAKIFHAGASLRATRKWRDIPLTKTIRTKTPVARKLVIDGLSLVLKLSEELTQGIKQYEPIREGQGARLRLRVYLEDFDVGHTSEDGYPVHPLCELQLDELKTELLPKGKFTVSQRPTIKFVNCRFAGDTNRVVELWGNIPTMERGEIS